MVRMLSDIAQYPFHVFGFGDARHAESLVQGRCFRQPTLRVHDFSCKVLRVRGNSLPRLRLQNNRNIRKDGNVANLRVPFAVIEYRAATDFCEKIRPQRLTDLPRQCAHHFPHSIT